jgi:hypothetical protein
MKGNVAELNFRQLTKLTWLNAFLASAAFAARKSAGSSVSSVFVRLTKRVGKIVEDGAALEKI